MAMKKTNAEQLDLFGASLPTIMIDKPIRLIELFGGIGSQAKALERLGVDFERWRLVEWAIPSIKAYAAIHDGWRGDDGSADGMGKEELVAFTSGVSQNYNEPISDERRARMGTKALREIASAMNACKDLVPDVSRVHPKDLGIEKEGDRSHAYIMSYSFPCQDLSGAGNRAGMEKGSGTRSGLLWEVERILLELERERERPDVLIMENVPQVCQKENFSAWNAWLSSLESMGYRNYPAIVSALDHGIPQRRKRCFMVSALGEFGYSFPKKRKLEKGLSDFLEPDPPAKYDLSERFLKCMLYEAPEVRAHQFTNMFKCTVLDDISPTLATRADRSAGMAFPLRVKIKDATLKGYLEAMEGDGIVVRTRKGGRGTVAKGSSPTICATGLIATLQKHRIRRLTPLECMRLMGFGDEDEEAMRAIGMSDAAITHCAGDSIVVDVLMDIFNEMISKKGIRQ